MNKPYNCYFFMLLFYGRKSYFYRCCAHSKDAAYKKMLIELMHDTTLLEHNNLKAVRLLHVLTDSNDDKFIMGLNYAAQKYYNFIHNFEYGAIQQFYYLNTRCTHNKWTCAGDRCSLNNKGCCMNSGIYCKRYTKGR